MSEFKEFENPWSADNSEWFNEEQDKWFDGGEFTEWLREVPKNQLSIRKRPRWAKVYEGYPKDSSGVNDLDSVSVFSEILGNNYDRSIFTNACATRVSLGLLNGGMIVSKNFEIKNGKFKGKGFIASAIGLKDWLSRNNVWGEADEFIKGSSDITDVKKRLGSRNGIYIIIGGFNGGISGHATLWIGAIKDAFAGNNYVSYGGDVYFWELI